MGGNHSAHGFVDVRSALVGLHVEAAPAEFGGNVFIHAVGVHAIFAVGWWLGQNWCNLVCDAGEAHIWVEANVVAVGHCHGEVNGAFPAFGSV